MKKAKLVCVSVASLAMGMGVIGGPAAEASGDVPANVVTGQVLAPSGAAVAGANVVILAWPNNLRAAPAKSGLVELGRAKSSTNGRFSVSARGTAVSAFEKSQGSPKSINISVLTSDEHGNFSVYDTTATVADAKSGSLSITPASTDPAAMNTAPDLPAVGTGVLPTAAANSAARSPISHAQGNWVTLSLRPAEKATPGARAMADVSVTANSAYTRLRNLGPKATLVGGLFSTGGTGWSGTFEYSKGQSSEIGVAVSGSGSAGSFSASGTNSVSSTVSIGYPAFSTHGSRYYRSNFNYGYYKVSYVTDHQVISYYQVRADGFNGGATVNSYSTATAFTYCDWYLPGSHFVKDRNKASIWTNGIGLPAPAGIGVSTQTGYSSTAKIDITMASNHGHYICGRKDHAGKAGSYDIEVRGS